MVAPYPWSSLPHVERRALPVLAALARWADVHGAWTGARIAVLGGAVARIDHVAVLAGEALAVRLSDVTAVVVAARGPGGVVHVVVPGMVVRRAAQRLLGGPAEIAAPRPLTVAERAVAVYLVAAALDPLDAAVEVEPTELAAPMIAQRLGEALVVDVGLALSDAPEPGARGARVAVVAAPAVLAALRPPDPPTRGRDARLAGEIAVPVVVATARLAATGLARLAVRDVILVDRVGDRGGAPGAARLAFGRGGVPVTLARRDGRLTVTGVYQRGPMNEQLAEDAATDLPIDLAVVVGEVRLSARAVLGLAPGQVLTLGAPVGAAVELRAAGRSIGRGELVEVDGEVGVRVLSLVP